MTTISCIIPTYNEETRIRRVLDVVTSHPLITEIVVVDDGSADATRKIVTEYPHVKLIVHERNQGKSMAIYTGIKASTGTFLLLIDADLIGMTQEDITKLIQPILEQRADVCISLRRNAPRLWHRIGIDYISGERIFPRNTIEPHLEAIHALPGFGLEVFFNRWIIRTKSRIKIVEWNTVDSPYKYKKYGWYRGIIKDIGMIYDIMKTISPIGPLYQIIKMRKLRVP